MRKAHLLGWAFSFICPRGQLSPASPKASIFVVGLKLHVPCLVRHLALESHKVSHSGRAAYRSLTGAARLHLRLGVIE
jgi:hypothetical protein